MKKLLVLLLVLVATFAAAQDEGIGLTAGLEFGITDINKPNDAEDVYPYLEVSVGYENSFLDDALDFSVGLAYDVGFTQEMNEDGDEVNPNGLSFDFGIGYNLGLGDASTLSFILANENYIDFVAKEDNILGIIKPGVKFNQNLDDNGDCYAQVDVPIFYVNYGLEKDDTFAGLDITLGWASAFGLGLEAGGHILFSPDDEIGDGETMNGFTGISFTASYENGPIYAELATTIPLKDLDMGYSPYSYFDTSAGSGISITPMFQYTFDFGLSTYLSLTFDGIGIKDNDPGVSLALGVTYSF